MAYRISQWEERFESSLSRNYDRCSHLYAPNKQDGNGFLRLMAEKDGMACFGLFMALAEACSRHPRPRQGWLTDDGTQAGHAWTASDIALRYRRPVREVTRAIQVLASPRIGWLEIVDSDSETQNQTDRTASALPVDYQCHTNLTNENKTKTKNDDEREGTDVVVLLEKEGLQDDPIRGHPNCTLETLQTAIANADAYRPGALKNRRAFICGAIRQGHQLSERARKRQQAAVRKAQAEAEAKSWREADQRNAAQQSDSDRLIGELSAEDLARLRDRALLELPPAARARVELDPARNTWLRWTIAKLRRSELKEHAGGNGAVAVAG